MKVLLLAKTKKNGDTYASMHLKLLQRVFPDNYTINAQVINNDKKDSKHEKFLHDSVKNINVKTFDVVIGVGDFHITRSGYTTEMFKGVPTIEFSDVGTEKRLTGSTADYLFYRIPMTEQPYKNTYYVGNSFPDEFLYIEERKTNKVTIWVDHLIRSQTDKTKEILTYLEGVYQKYPVRILHQGRYGISQDLFSSQNDKNDAGYVCLDYDIITSLYRKVDIYMPTHKETIGMMSGEIGLCGGLTLLEDYMYPEAIKKHIPYVEYKNLQSINWDSILEKTTEKHRLDRRKQSLENYGFECYKKRCISSVTKILEQGK